MLFIIFDIYLNVLQNYSLYTDIHMDVNMYL